MLKSALAALATVLTLSSAAHAMTYRIESVERKGHPVNVVRVEGTIGIGEWRAWMAMTTGLQSADTLFVLSSPGGNATHGLFLLRFVASFQEEQAAAGHRVMVLATKDCSSMCVPLFYGFNNRVALENTRFGLHGIHDDLSVDQNLTGSYLDAMKDLARARGDEDFPTWISDKEARGVFASSDLDVNIAKTMSLQKSGIVPIDAIVSSEKAALERLTH